MTVTYSTASAFSHYAGEGAGPDSLGRIYALLNSLSGIYNPERYDPATDAWTTLSSFTLGTYLQQSGGWSFDSSDRLLYACGLRFNQPPPPGGTLFQGTNIGWIYDPATDSFALITPLAVGQARWFPNFWTSGGLLHIAGGYIGPGNSASDGTASGTFANTWRYSGGTGGTWTALGNMTAARGHGYFGPNLKDSLGRVYAIGGQLTFPVPSPSFVLADVDRWDPATGNWTALAPLPKGLVAFACAIDPATDDIYVTQGFGTTSSVSTYRYNNAANTWSTLANCPKFAGSPMGLFANGYFYTIGGGSTQNRGIYGYSVATDTWCLLPDQMFEDQTFRGNGISDGAGGWRILDIDGVSGGGSQHVVHFTPNSPFPCIAPPTARGRSYAQVIG